MSVKVTVKLDSVEAITNSVRSKSTQQKAAKLTIEDVVRTIKKGISPVFGERRFQAYKDPKKYPAGKKQTRPVNLTLSGDMLKALKFKLNSKSFTIGWTADDVHKKKANNHNTGDTVPERRLLPTKKGERFNVSITRKLRNFYANAISDILKRAK